MARNKKGAKPIPFLFVPLQCDFIHSPIKKWTLPTRESGLATQLGLVNGILAYIIYVDILENILEKCLGIGTYYFADLGNPSAAII